MKTLTHRKIIDSLFITAALLFGLAGSALAKERLTLVTVANSLDTVISEVIIREAYRRLGIEMLIKKYPPERAIRLADFGEVDGEVQRIKGL